MGLRVAFDCHGQICQDGGGAEDIYEGDFEEEDPTQSHQLIIAETRQSEADPDENEKEGRDFGEKTKMLMRPKIQP